MTVLMLLLHFLLTVVAALELSRPEIFSTTPASGSSAGGFRVSIAGRNLAQFPFQARVTLKSGLECSDVRIDSTWMALSCVMPACARCGDTTLRVTVSGRASNALPFHYAEECYDSKAPQLPHRYSAAENCVRQGRGGGKPGHTQTLCPLPSPADCLYGDGAYCRRHCRRRRRTPSPAGGDD